MLQKMNFMNYRGFSFTFSLDNYLQNQSAVLSATATYHCRSEMKDSH